VRAPRKFVLAILLATFGFTVTTTLPARAAEREPEAEREAMPVQLVDRGEPDRVPTPRMMQAKARFVSAADLRALAERERLAPARREEGEEAEGEDGNESEEPRIGLGQPSPEAYAPPPAAPQQVSSTYGYAQRILTPWSVTDTLGFSPADCVIAAGASQVVTCYNSQIMMWSKTGQRLFSLSLGGLLGDTPGWSGFFDPKVEYDEGSGRFYLMALNRHPTQRQALWDVAVSATGDPTQGWYVYEWRTELDGEGIDYEELGFGPRALYLSGNYISFPGWTGSAAIDHKNAFWILNKTAMLSGQPVTSYAFTDVQGSASAAISTPKVTQVHVAPAGGVDGFMVAFQHMSIPANTLRVSVYGVTLPGNFPTGAPTFTRQEVDFTDHADPPNAVQKGGPALLQTNNLGSPPLACQFRNNTLYIATHATDGTRPKVRILSIGCTWPTLTAGMDVSLVDFVNALFWPGLAVNAYGDLSTLYCWSGTDQWSGLRWNTRERDESGFFSYQLLKAGEVYVGNAGTDNAATTYRWGDYTGMAVDPVEQGFWYFGMYAYNRGVLNNNQWRCYVGYAPRAVFADLANGGSEIGSRLRPWNTVGEAQNDARSGNDLVLKAGTYPENGLVLSKPMTIIPDGGTVQIGTP
jgi:hypothetical protein